VFIPGPLGPIAETHEFWILEVADLHRSEDRLSLNIDEVLYLYGGGCACGGVPLGEV